MKFKKTLLVNCGKIASAYTNVSAPTNTTGTSLNVILEDVNITNLLKQLDNNVILDYIKNNNITVMSDEEPTEGLPKELEDLIVLFLTNRFKNLNIISENE